MVEFIQDALDRRMIVIEEKLRNSFRAIKVDNEEIRKKIDDLSNAVKNTDCSKGLEDLNKKIVSNEDSFKKFKKDISRDSMKKEVVREVLPIFNEKIKVGLQSFTKENKEMIKDLNAFKEKWASVSEEKLKVGLENMRANFAKLDKEVKNNEINNIKLFEKQNSRSRSEVKAVKNSTRKEIDAQNKLIDQYSAKLEEYSAELESGYSNSKKEILSSSERKFNALKLENDADVAKLKGQMAYLKGRVSKELGVEVKEVKPVAKVSEKKSVKGPGFFSKFVKLLSDEDGEKIVKPVLVKVEVKKVEAKPVVKKNTIAEKNKNIFSNLISLLADESPETKVTVKNTKQKVEVSKKSAKNYKSLPKAQAFGEKIKDDAGFFNSIIKSLSD